MAYLTQNTACICMFISCLICCASFCRYLIYPLCKIGLVFRKQKRYIDVFKGFFFCSMKENRAFPCFLAIKQAKI